MINNKKSNEIIDLLTEIVINFIEENKSKKNMVESNT